MTRRQITRGGIAVEVGPNLRDQRELRARVRVPSEVRLGVRYDWAVRRPPPAGDIWRAPIIRVEHGALLLAHDPEVTSPIEGFDPALTKLIGCGRAFGLGTDGEAVILWIDADQDEVLELAADVVAALARHDAGLTALLHALPDAVPLDGHELEPGVSLGTDGLVVGVERGELIAQLDAVTTTPRTTTVLDGRVTGDPVSVEIAALLDQAGGGALVVTSSAARFTWARIARQRERLLAGVRALRRLRHTDGAYR